MSSEIEPESSENLFEISTQHRYEALKLLEKWEILQRKELKKLSSLMHKISERIIAEGNATLQEKELLPFIKKDVAA